LIKIEQKFFLLHAQNRLGAINGTRRALSRNGVGDRSDGKAETILIAFIKVMSNEVNLLT